MHVDGRVFEGSDAQDVAVFALQGGAGEDHTIGCAGLMGGGLGEEGFDRFVAEQDEPVPAVGVCEGFAAGHFGDVGGGVVLGRHSVSVLLLLYAVCIHVSVSFDTLIAVPRELRLSPARDRNTS